MNRYFNLLVLIRPFKVCAAAVSILFCHIKNNAHLFLRLKMAAALLAIFSVGQTAYAADDSLQVCVSLAEKLTNLRFTMTNEQSRAISYMSKCSNNSNSVGLSVVVGEVPVGGTVKTDDIDCSKTLAGNRISSAAFEYVKAMSDKALDTVNKCMEDVTSTKNWSVDPQMSLDSVNVSIQNNESNGGNIEDISINPPGSLTCSGIPPTFPAPLAAGKSPVIVKCSRKPSTQYINGEVDVSAEDAEIDLMLSGGSYPPIKLLGYSSRKNTEAQIGEIKDAQGRLIESLQTWPRESREGIITNNGYNHVISCEPGSYAAGITWYGSEQRFCRGCTAAIGVICRKLNTGAN